MSEEKKIKIVLVEDEEVLLEVLESKLKKEGYEVFSAKDGQAGLDLIGAIRPDLVLLDIIMPRMDGLEVLAHLHNDAILSHIPVIIISNSGQEVEIEKAKALGARDYLVKAEFDPQEVLDKMRALLHLEGKEQKVVAPEKNGGKGDGAKVNPADFRVLLVEDDSFLRDLISQKMKKEGFTVIEAIDGEESLKKAVSENPHIILLDLILPGADGFEILRKMRAEPATSKVPIIVLSNLGQKEDVEKGIMLGATDYLVKAHNTPGEIIDKIKEILSRSY
ncbi:MAG: response regulator [Candidatus Azambacteria bacterium]|nr:response regulator [Candidatus Azambacteria bacterium]